MRSFAGCGSGGIANDLFQHLQVLKKAPASERGYFTSRLRAVLLEALGNFDQLRIDKDLQMAA